jgi:hypothetical protein
MVGGIVMNNASGMNCGTMPIATKYFIQPEWSLLTVLY